MIEQINGIVSCADMARAGVEHCANLEPAYTYYRQKPILIDSHHMSESNKPALADVFANMRTDAHPISIFRLKNALVYGQGSVVLHNGLIVLDSVIEFINHGLAPDGSSKDGSRIVLNKGPVKNISGTTLLIKRPWYRNFGHWLVDLMPIVALVKKYDVEFENIILGNVPQSELRRIMDTAVSSLLPGKNTIYADDNEHLYCENLAYISPVHVPPFSKHPAALAAAEDSCRSVFKSLGAPNAGERIYVKRSQNAARHIKNEDELLKIIERYNFKIVIPEDFSFDEQISIFSSAKVVLGVKGAALTNMLFSSAGSHMIALSPADWIDPFFWDLISPRGVSYSEIYCEATDRASVSMANIVVDIRRLEECFAMLSL